MTFAFSIENWHNLIRVGWAPFVLLTAVGFAFQTYRGSGLAELVARWAALTEADVQTFNTEIFCEIQAVNLIVGLLPLVMFPGLFRFVMRGQKPSLTFNIRWGVDEWRLLGTFVILFLTWMLVVFCAALVLAIPTALLASGGFSILVAPVAVVGGLWFLTRTFLIGPATISEEQIGLGPGWRASGGQSRPLPAYILLWLAMGATVQVLVTLIVTSDVAKIMVEMFTWPPRSEITQETAMRIQEAIAANTPFGMFRVLLLTILGIAWRLIDEDRPQPATRIPEGSARDIMAF